MGKKRTSEGLDPVVSADVEIEDSSNVSSLQKSSRKRKKLQQSPPAALEKLFVEVMKELSSANSFETDFDRAKQYAVTLGLSEEDLSNSQYKESLFLTYLRAYKKYTERRDITFHFPFSKEQLSHRYPEFLGDNEGDRESLLCWLNWITLAQKALQRSKGVKCLLLSVLGHLLESDSHASASNKAQPKGKGKDKGVSMSQHGQYRSTMYDREAASDLTTTVTSAGKEIFVAVSPAMPDMKSSSPPPTYTTKRKRAVSPPDLYTPQMQAANTRPDRGMKRPVKPPELFVPGGDPRGTSQVTFNLDLLSVPFPDLLSEEEVEDMSPRKKKKKKPKAKAKPVAASKQMFAETGTGVGMGGCVSPTYTTPTFSSYADMLPICTDALALRRPPSRVLTLPSASASASASAAGKLDCWEEEEFELNSSPIPMFSNKSIYCPKPVVLSRERSFDLESSSMLSGCSQPDFSDLSVQRTQCFGKPLTRGAQTPAKNQVVRVDACTSTEGSCGVDKPFVSCFGFEFTHPELIHELSILSWLSNQVDNENFQIGVAMPSSVPKSEDSALFPGARANKRTADFLTTCVLLDPGSPAILPPPRLQHTCSAFAPFSPLMSSSPFARGPSTPMSAPSAPRKVDLARGYSWGCLGQEQASSSGSGGGSSHNLLTRTPPRQSFAEVLAGYAPVSSSNSSNSSNSSKSCVQNFEAAGIFSSALSGAGRN